MRFVPTLLEGVFVVETEPQADARGFFARTFCSREFQEQGLETGFVQCSVSLSHKRGTLRGLHYQQEPACEVKLVRCTAGAIWDVVVDLRPQSRTYLQHVAVELTARNRRALYIPQMFAHGLQTLVDDTEVLYQIGAFYAPEHARGLRFDDPRLGISWPLPVSDLSEKDRSWPLLPPVSSGGAGSPAKA
jgi:dTDP-4-dehydrorhamnose 3,5-epimerase